MSDPSSDHLFTNRDMIKLYKQYRTTTPAVVVNKIMDYLKVGIPPPYRRCLDVGCGSGQSTGAFAQYFQDVIGQDISEAQLEQGRKVETNSNVTYRLGRAEALQCEDQSCELVYASSAAHWFDLPKFFEEVERVLVPNGVLCLYGSTNRRLVHETFTDDLWEAYKEVALKLAPYKHPKRKLAAERFSTIDLPFDPATHVKLDDVFIERPFSLSDMAGRIQTMSPFQTLKENNPDEAENIIVQYLKRCLLILGATDPASTMLTLREQFYMVMCRKPAHGKPQ